MTHYDQIDTSRAKVFALIYYTASINAGVLRAHADIHGLYETFEAASKARASKTHPENYEIINGHWRRDLH